MQLLTSRCIHHVRSTGLAVAYVALSLAAFFKPGGLYAASPELKYLTPPGGQRGSTVRVTCIGDFSWPVSILAPGVEVSPCDESGKMELSIPDNLAADRVWIRLYNAQGISTAVPFLIGTLHEISEEEPNNSPGNAQAVSDESVTINGILQKRGDVDGYSVELTSGQTLVAAVDANSRLDSPMDAILQVATVAGTVLAENHDAVGLDPRLAFTATKSGNYIIRIFAFPAKPGQKIFFSGDDDYVYRLTLTTGPYITHTIQLSAPQTDPGEVELFGWNILPGTTLPVVPFGGSTLANYVEHESPGDLRNAPNDQLGLVFGMGYAGCARVRLVSHTVTSSATTSLTTSNLTAQTDRKDAMELPPSNTVTGLLRTPGQTDTYRLPLTKGQHITIAVESQNLYSPMVPVLRLNDPTGAMAAEVSETGPPKDAVISYTVSDDGDYLLIVGDRFRHGGERYFYRLTVRVEEPDFELFARADSLVITPDKPTEFSITVKRRGSQDGEVGPIKIAAIDLPAGVTSAAVASQPTGPTSTEVKLVFSTTGPAYSGPIRIRGTVDQPKEIRRFARTPPKHAISFEAIWLTVLVNP